MTQIQSDQNEAVAARNEALEESGWGVPFHFVQPRNAGFWVYSLLVVWGVFALLQLALPGTRIAQGSLAASTVLFAIYSLPFIWFFRRIDRFRAVPVALAIAAFVWGGFAATSLVAVNGNDALFSIYGNLFGDAFVPHWGPALAAPFTEELGKGAGMLLLILLAPRLINTAFAGLIVGSFIGLGFQIIEDIVYGFRGGSSGFDLDNVQGAFHTVLMRVGVGLFSHWIYSGIFCAGLVWFLGRPQQQRRRGLGLALMAAAMLSHGLWDAAAGLSSVSIFLLPLSYILVPVGLILMYRWIYKTTIVTERGWAQGVLAPEVVDGVASQAEVDAHVGTRKQRKAFIGEAKGHSAHASARHTVEAVGDLLYELCRSRGTTSPEVARARSELSRVRGAAS